MRKTLFFQKKIKLFNVQFMVLHESAQIEENVIVLKDFPARLNAMFKLVGRYNNMRQPTTHNAGEMFFKFSLLPFSSDTARSRCTFLAMMNNLRLININGGRNKTMRMIKFNELEITKLPLEIVNMTIVKVSNIARKLRRFPKTDYHQCV